MTTNDEQPPAGRRPVHGQVSYLQIPATDVLRSAAFYEGIFGWRIERPHPEFEAPGLIGQWVSDRPAAPDAGLLAWIQVDRIDETLDLVRASGGEVLEPPAPDGPVGPDGPPRWLATIRDPGGNVLGIVQLGHRSVSRRLGRPDTAEEER